MQLNTEKTQTDVELKVFEEVTNGMADFIVLKFGTLIKQNLILFSSLEFLLERIDEINSKPAETKASPFDAMTVGFCIEKLDALIKTKRLNAASGNITLLTLAIVLNDIKSLEKLLTMKIDFPYSAISLFVAMFKLNNLKIINLLLEQESFQKALNTCRVLPSTSILYYALNKKKFDLARYFISKGAHFSSQESFEIFKLAELYEHPDLLKDVLTSYRTYREDCDFTPLAIFAPNFETLRLFIMHGASLKEPFIPPFLKGLHISNALRFAVYIEDLELCAKILSREMPEDIQGELYLAVFKNNIDIIKFLLCNCLQAKFDANLLLKKILDLPLEKQVTAISQFLENDNFNNKLTHDVFMEGFHNSLEKNNFEIAALMLKSTYFKCNYVTFISKILASITETSRHIEKFCSAIKDIIHQSLGKYDFFYYALQYNNKTLIEHLVNNGANVNIVYEELTSQNKLDEGSFALLTQNTTTIELFSERDNSVTNITPPSFFNFKSKRLLEGNSDFSLENDRKKACN